MEAYLRRIFRELRNMRLDLIEIKNTNLITVDNIRELKKVMEKSNFMKKD